MGRRKYGYGNYDLHPCKKITGFDQCVFDGAESLVSELLSGKNKKKTVELKKVTM